LARLEWRLVGKTYARDVEALCGVDLAVADGELLAVVGPSGSGKSTLLRLVAGLETPSLGGVWIDGRQVDGLPPHQRQVALVFQSPALYPHLSVFDNIAFGLRAMRTPRRSIRPRVEEVAELLRVRELLERRPPELSGGERQRVALGRAIAPRPALLLLDEPFASLDSPLRAATRADLVALHRRLGTTMVLVTHDQAEALAVADRVAILDRGRVAQLGTPREVYDHPASAFVARFIGSPPMNVLPVLIDHRDGTVHVRIDGIEGGQRVDFGMVPRAGLVLLGIRPEHVRITQERDGLLGSLRRLEPAGEWIVATLAVGPHELAIRLPWDPARRLGERVVVFLDMRHASWFDAESGADIGGGPPCRS
jgi:ABC-type sugar transport system ATPase subunit